MKIRHIKPSPFVQDIILTAISLSVVMACSIYITRLLALGFGPVGLGIYSLAKRIIAIVQTCSTMSMGVAVARFTSLVTDHDSRVRYLIAGVFISTVPSFVIFSAGLVFLKPLSLAIFHDDKYSNVILAILVTLTGISFYTVLYGFYRGKQDMGKANLWNLIIGGLGPLVIAFSLSDSMRIGWILFLMGSLYLCTIVPLCAQILPNLHLINGIKRFFKELLQYGFPRVFHNIFGSLMFSIGPFLAAYFLSFEEVSYLVLAQTVMKIPQFFTGPFGLIALPKAVSLYSEGKKDYLIGRVHDVMCGVVHIGVFLTIQIYIWGDSIIIAWVGNEFIESVSLMRMLSVSLVPYMLYAAFRSIIDAVEVRAVNSINIMVSIFANLIISLLLIYFGLGITGLAVGNIVGVFVLGFMSMLYLYRNGWIVKFDLKLKTIFYLNFVGMVVAVLFKEKISYLLWDGVSIIPILLFELLLGILYLFSLKYNGVKWVILIERRIWG